MLEQELASTTLLFKEGQNGSYEFIHKTWQEFFVAKWFAKEINSGRLSVKDAYNNYWSYDLQHTARYVKGRSLLPAWQGPVSHLAAMFNKPNARELANLVMSSYYDARKKLSRDETNPFTDDLLFLAHIYKSLRIANETQISRTIDALIREYNVNPEEFREALSQMGCPNKIAKVVTRLRSNHWVEYEKFKILSKVDSQAAFSVFKKELDHWQKVSKIDKNCMDWFHGQDVLELHDIDFLSIWELDHLADNFVEIMEGVRREDFISFYQSLLNGPNRKVKWFALKMRSDVEKYLKDDPSVYDEKFARKLHAGDFPTKDEHGRWFLGSNNMEQIVAKYSSIRDGDLIVQYINCTGQKQKEAALLIKDRHITDAEPICLEKLQSGSLDEKIFSVWLLGHVGSSKSIPIVRDLCRTYRNDFNSRWLMENALSSLLDKAKPEGYRPQIMEKQLSTQIPMEHVSEAAHTSQLLLPFMIKNKY